MRRDAETRVDQLHERSRQLRERAEREGMARNPFVKKVLGTFDEMLQELSSLVEQLECAAQELHASERYVAAILDGIGVAALVVDRHFQVLSWADEMRQLFGLMADEVEAKSLFDLDIGLPVAELRPAVEACLRGDAESPTVELEAVNRRGVRIRCAVTCRPLHPADEVAGVIVMVQVIADGDGALKPQTVRGDGLPGNRAP